MSLRVVIDTNIWVSSFRGGNPRKVIDLLDEGAFILCISDEIITEYFRIIEKFPVLEEERQGILYHCRNAQSVNVSDLTVRLHLVEKDPDDNKFIECAFALQADYIVTGDKALLEVGKYKKTKIVTPKQFLDIIHEHNQ